MPPRRIYEHSGPVELVLEGENLTPETLKLYHNGVLYTPLESSDTYAYYLLGDNGTNKVMLNGKNFCTVVVKDIIVPNILPARLFVANRENYGTTQDSSKYGESAAANAVNCINAPIRPTESHPYMYFSIFEGNLEDSDFAFENVTRSQVSVAEARTNAVMELADSRKPAYIKYQGFIIAVFNYSA